MLRCLPLSWQHREGRRSLSSNSELLIYLAVLAALWVGYNVRKVRRERNRPPGLSTTAPYDDNLAIFPVGGQHSSHGGHRGRISGHGGHVTHSGPVSHGGHEGGFSGHDAGGGPRHHAG